MSDEEVRQKLESHRPPDWLTDTVPRKTPYFPQMGDEILYLRQGHELYVKAVERHKSYPIDPNKNQPWHKNPHLRVSVDLLLIKISLGIRTRISG